MILLMSDGQVVTAASDSAHYKQVLNAQNDMGGYCHVVASLSHKAKRVSSSTSTAETLSATIGKEIAQLVAMRMTEVFGTGIQTSLRGTAGVLSEMISIQEAAAWAIPIDHFTDCRDLFQLVVGEKGIPQDRYQRLYILSLREDRIKGAIRYFFWIPTLSMIVDALTKVLVSPQLYDLLTHGWWQMKCVQGQAQAPLVALPPADTARLYRR